MTHKNEENETSHTKVLKDLEEISNQIEEFSSSIQTKILKIKKNIFSAQEEISFLKKQKREVYGMYFEIKKTFKNEKNNHVIKYDEIDPMSIYGIGLKSLLSMKDCRTNILFYLNNLDISRLKTAITGKSYPVIEEVCCVCRSTPNKLLKCSSCGEYMCAIVKSSCIKRVVIKGAAKFFERSKKSTIWDTENVIEVLCINCYSINNIKHKDLNYRYCITNFRYGKCRKNYEEKNKR
jgi:hypothetical protein